MGSRFDGLPPVKRFRLMQQQEDENVVVNETKRKPISPLRLPAKKRKESRDSTPFPLPPRPPPYSSGTTTQTYCLPAKKRVWAIQPFDLNVEYPDSEKSEIIPKGEETEDKIVPRVDEIAGNDDDDDGIVCAVCESTDGDPTDPIVLCDGCDIMVHTTCYGHPFTNGIPEGDWFCAQCLAAKSTLKPGNPGLTCCLCPVSGGALKPTNDGKWAHLVCALFVPEVFFSEPEGREGIDLSKVPKRRWEQRCYICKSRSGCAIDCSEPRCPLAFHVTCGLKQELCIEYREGKNKGAIVAGFCKTHTDLWKKQEQTGKFKIVARDEHNK